MAVNRLKDTLPIYDVIVIGSGLGGLTSANYLAKHGYRVLLLEHHYQFGGLATWFRRKHKHIFDISLHGFPVGMIKSCRRYWSEQIANKITPLKQIRFINPQFDISTSFDKEDVTELLISKFQISPKIVASFFAYIKNLNFYDNAQESIGELFENFFPGRKDVHRFLLEPISYANGSELSDPAITFAIVYSNFMNKGAYIFQGGADEVIGKMVEQARKNGVDLRKFCTVEKILVKNNTVEGVLVNGKIIKAKSVLSNANLKTTLHELLEKDTLSTSFQQEAMQVRLNCSTRQVYMGIEEGQVIPYIGDLIFASEAKEFSTDELLGFHTKSRTFSLYYPEARPQNKIPRYSIVSSMNARWQDWAMLKADSYLKEKERLCAEALQSLEKFLPQVRSKINWLEAATPRTVNRFTRHMQGASFGTKFEGLKVSENLPLQIQGLYHAGSVGIIMSGWLGAINYGIIVANKVDLYLKNLQNLYTT